MLTADVLGFDTESKPTFLKGEQSDGPHLIQLASVQTPVAIGGISDAASAVGDAGRTSRAALDAIGAGQADAFSFARNIASTFTQNLNSNAARAFDSVDSANALTAKASAGALDFGASITGDALAFVLLKHF